MMNVIALLWLGAFVLCTFCAIRYVRYMVESTRAKRCRTLAKLIAVPILALGMLIVATRIVARVSYSSYMSDIYDVEVNHGEPIFEYHSSRAFNGDGYSLQVYKLGASIRDRFIVADAYLFEHFPKRSKNRDHWDTVSWREAPCDPDFDVYISFALSGGNGSGLAEHFDDIRAALKRRGTFYSFFKFDPSTYPMNIDLFIVDLRRGRVYEINCNT